MKYKLFQTINSSRHEGGPLGYVTLIADVSEKDNPIGYLSFLAGLSGSRTAIWQPTTRQRARLRVKAKKKAGKPSSRWADTPSH